MLTDHDQDVLPRCRRLGHEITFGYCRRESGTQPCRLILDCWWEKFDVRGFLAAHLPPEAMAQVEAATSAAPPERVANLLTLVDRTKERLSQQPLPPKAGSKP